MTAAFVYLDGQKLLTDRDAFGVHTLQTVGGGGGGGGAGDASAANQASQIALATTLNSYVDTIEALLGTNNTSTALLSTEATLASVLTKLSSDPATQATLAALLAKFPALGGNVAAALSVGVGLSNEDIARLGPTTIAGNAASAATATGGINDILRGLFQWQIGLNTFTTIGATNVSTTAVSLIPASVARRFGAVKNMNASLTVYIGASGVTSATGWPLLPGEGLDISQMTGAVWGSTTSGTASVAAIAW